METLLQIENDAINILDDNNDIKIKCELIMQLILKLDNMEQLNIIEKNRRKYILNILLYFLKTNE